MGGSPGGGGRRAWPLFIGLPLIAALAVAAVILVGGGQTLPSADREPPAADSGVEEQGPELAGEEEQAAGNEEQASGGETGLGHPALGDEDAPVVMVEYADYQ